MTLIVKPSDLAGRNILSINQIGRYMAPTAQRSVGLIEDGTLPSDLRAASKLILAWLDDHLGLVNSR